MSDNEEIFDIEEREWVESLDWIIKNESPERVREILQTLQIRAQQFGVSMNAPINTPYINTISQARQRPYPGSRELERRIKSVVRWNAMAMVVRANKGSSGIGGHISSYASSATLVEVAFNHFLRGENVPGGPDIAYFQGHAAPGVYARSFVEGRLTKKDLENFRQELRPEGGLTSYPHPRSMPEYWQYPTVSMGLGPIQAIYQARFMRYLENNGHKEPSDQKVWAFLGDGEFDEPESVGALALASREQLDNLVFVVSCNLQRLDGPVRGNFKVVQELEGIFRGAGWNVIKVIWGEDWDPLLDKDQDGVLVRRMDQVVDGQVQKYTVSSGDYIREHFFGTDERLKRLVENYSDEQLESMRRGGHDPVKVYNAYYEAVNHSGQPTVVLAQTVKGYGLGEAGEGRNVTHSQKKLNEDELREFRSRFGIPISDDDLPEAPFYSLPQDSEEMKYLTSRREELGGYLPKRTVSSESLQTPSGKLFDQFKQGSGDRTIATTMVMVQILGDLLKDKNIGERIVPIVPDESRTFGMESLFRQVGIYSPVGQIYEPVDKESLMYYKEAKDGAILEEGITEAGCMASFIAAGTSYATYSIPMVPMFIYYSMFGFQRVGDLIWAAGDSRARGFMIGGTAGRSTLPGEGLQHCDGHSHLLAMSVPSVRAYDPAFAYEVAAIVRDGLQKMFAEGQDLIYYITVMNETYQMPPMPDGVEEGILKGLYKYRASDKGGAKAHLLGSGAILNEAIQAQEMLENDYGVATDVWSATGYKQLYQDAVETERWNMLNPDKKTRTSYLQECFSGENGIAVAASDYMKAVPLTVAKWMPLPFSVLGTDGWGRSDNRGALRDYFEVDAKHIVLAALTSLAEKGEIQKNVLKKAASDLKIDGDKLDPVSL